MQLTLCGAYIRRRDPLCVRRCNKEFLLTSHQDLLSPDFGFSRLQGSAPNESLRPKTAQEVLPHFSAPPRPCTSKAHAALLDPPQPRLPGTRHPNHQPLTCPGPPGCPQQPSAPRAPANTGREAANDGGRQPGPRRAGADAQGAQQGATAASAPAASARGRAGGAGGRASGRGLGRGPLCRAAPRRLTPPHTGAGGEGAVALPAGRVGGGRPVLRCGLGGLGGAPGAGGRPPGGHLAGGPHRLAAGSCRARRQLRGRSASLLPLPCFPYSVGRRSRRVLPAFFVVLCLGLYRSPPGGRSAGEAGRRGAGAGGTPQPGCGRCWGGPGRGRSPVPAGEPRRQPRPCRLQPEGLTENGSHFWAFRVCSFRGGGGDFFFFFFCELPRASKSLHCGVVAFGGGGEEIETSSV